MAYEMVMPYHLHMPSYFLETFTEYPFLSAHFIRKNKKLFASKQNSIPPEITHYIRRDTVLCYGYISRTA